MCVGSCRLFLFQESPGIDYLIKTYPRYTSVDSLPMEDGTTSKKVQFERAGLYRAEAKW